MNPENNTYIPPALPPQSPPKKKPIIAVVLVIVAFGLGFLTAWIIQDGRASKTNKVDLTNISPDDLDGLTKETFEGIERKSRDTERETDIKAIHSQVEAYWAQTGYYPSLANLNSEAFRSTNLKGLDQEALKDPQGETYTIAASMAKGVYAYSVLPKGCDNTSAGSCTSYVLTATLEDKINGVGTYTKTSLNN